jgi:hypothetical protein
LFNITHSARSDMAASVTSARDGMPVLARDSSTCVAQITGVSRLANPENLFLDLGHAFESALDGQVAARDHHAEASGAHACEQ